MQMESPIASREYQDLVTRLDDISKKLSAKELKEIISMIEKGK